MLKKLPLPPVYPRCRLASDWQHRQPLDRLWNIACVRAKAQGISAVYPTLQSNTHYTFTIETNSDQWFIFSQNNLPGWTVTIDGTPTQSYRANFLFQAIRVPAGKHVVEWEYVLF